MIIRSVTIRIFNKKIDFFIFAVSNLTNFNMKILVSFNGRVLEHTNSKNEEKRKGSHGQCGKEIVFPQMI